MQNAFKRGLNFYKVRGLKKLLSAVRWKTDKLLRRIYNPNPLLDLLEDLYSDSDKVIVQIGANIGKTDSDPLYRYFERNFGPHYSVDQVRGRAILVEPVHYLFEELKRNYTGFSNLYYENVAIAEKAGLRDFFRLDEQVASQITEKFDFLPQIGSLVPERTKDMWKTQ